MWGNQGASKVTEVIASGEPKDSWQSWSPAHRPTPRVAWAGVPGLWTLAKRFHLQLRRVLRHQLTEFGNTSHLHSSVSTAQQLLCDKHAALGELSFRPSRLLSRSYKAKHRSHCHSTTQASYSLKQDEPRGDGTPGPAGPSLPSQCPSITASEWSE